jgi:hypothetical protein
VLVGKSVVFPLLTLEPSGLRARARAQALQILVYAEACASTDILSEKPGLLKREYRLGRWGGGMGWIAGRWEAGHRKGTTGSSDSLATQLWLKTGS